MNLVKSLFFIAVLFIAAGCNKHSDDPIVTQPTPPTNLHQQGYVPTGKPKRVLLYTMENQDTPGTIIYFAYDVQGNKIQDSTVENTPTYSYLFGITNYTWQDGRITGEDIAYCSNPPDSLHAWDKNFKNRPTGHYTFNSKGQVQEYVLGDSKYEYFYNDFDSLQTKYLIKNSPPSFDFNDTTWRMDYSYDNKRRLHSEYQYQQQRLYQGGGFVEQNHFIYLYDNKLPSSHYYRMQVWGSATEMISEHYYYYDGDKMVAEYDPTNTFPVATWEFSGEQIMTYNLFVGGVKKHFQVYEY